MKMRIPLRGKERGSLKSNKNGGRQPSVFLAVDPLPWKRKGSALFKSRKGAARPFNPCFVSFVIVLLVERGLLAPLITFDLVIVER